MIFHILGHLSTSKHILVILIRNVGEAFKCLGICGLMSLRIHKWILNVLKCSDNRTDTKKSQGKTRKTKKIQEKPGKIWKKTRINQKKNMKNQDN